MKDVAAVLRRYVGDDKLPQLLADLEASSTGQANTFFREFIRRIRKSAGLPTLADPNEPKDLLALMGELENN